VISANQAPDPNSWLTARGVRASVPVYHHSRAALTPLTWRGPPPRFHESLWGVLQKLSHLNALELRDRRELLAMRPGTTGYLGRLHSSIALEADPLQSWSLYTMEPITVPSGEPSRLDALRFCEACLETGFHSVIFQMPELGRCPAHDLELQERCPACGAAVDYCLWRADTTVNAFECRCGNLLWRHRDRVKEWYHTPHHMDRLDGFVHRLLNLERSSATVWFRIDRPNIGVSRTSGVAERLGAISPTELLKLPRVYRRFLREEVLMAGAECDHFELSAGVETRRIVAADWPGELLQQAERDVIDALSAHKRCIEEVTRAVEHDGPVLSVDLCPLANAFVLWRAHWRTRAPQLELCRLLEWHTCMTVSALRERQITYPASSDSAATGDAVATCGSGFGEGSWLKLWKVLGRQVLIESMMSITGFVRKIIESSDLKYDCLTHRLACPDSDPLRTEMPPVWAIIEPRRPHMLELRHTGYERLRVLNQGFCLSNSERNCSANLQRSLDQQLPKRRSVLAALDHGLSFPQLGVGCRRS
jgi:hypothetical protein